LLQLKIKSPRFATFSRNVRRNCSSELQAFETHGQECCMKARTFNKKAATAKNVVLSIGVYGVVAAALYLAWGNAGEITGQPAAVNQIAESAAEQEFANAEVGSGAPVPATSAPAEAVAALETGAAAEVPSAHVPDNLDLPEAATVVPTPRPRRMRDAAPATARVEIFDRCMPDCDTQDPKIVGAASSAVPISMPEPELAEMRNDDRGFAPLREAGVILRKTVSVPGAAFRRGREAVTDVVSDVF
jgi:hypothetical protein